MSCDANTEKGKDAVILMRNSGDTAWLIVGGAKTKSRTLDSPVEDVTSQSTNGNFTESEHTGFSTLNLSVSGVFDNRSGSSRSIGGTSYAYASTKELAQVAIPSDGVKAAWQFLLIYKDMDISGCFNISSYETSGDTTGLINFSMNLQNKGQPTITHK